MLAARHIMDDEDEHQQEPLIPQVHATFEKADSFGHVIIVPSTMAVIVQTLEKFVCGNISVRYSQLESTESIEGEFDEDEQLYSAANIGASRRKYPDTDIPLYTISGAGSAGAPVLAVVVPHLTNPIAEKAVASQIAVLAPSAKSWIALSPSVSALSKADKLNDIGLLALNSEGHPGFEKVDADAIMDATTEVFGEIFDPKAKASALKKLSSVVRKINSSSTSGMYL
ncbi:hypothetical protein JCM33374_g1780 [Metschnikowia sp. JCM 33374]|nr:hypothetical protein JCM33374_g1780 [Metschnikowia sp. JCM 33374]